MYLVVINDSSTNAKCLFAVLNNTCMFLLMRCLRFVFLDDDHFGEVRVPFNIDLCFDAFWLKTKKLRLFEGFAESLGLLFSRFVSVVLRS